MLYNLTGKIVQGGTMTIDPTLTLVNAAAQAKATGDALRALNDGIESHASNKENPHGITKAQLGLGEVDDTADMDKPVSNKQKVAIDLAVTAAKNEMEVSVTYAKDTADEAKAAAEEAKADVAELEAKVDADGTVTTAKFAADAVAPKATQLATSRNITVKDSSGTYSSEAVSFDGSGDITLKIPETVQITTLIAGSGLVGAARPENPVEGQLFFLIEEDAATDGGEGDAANV